MNLFNHTSNSTQHISIIEKIMHSIAHIFHLSSSTKEAIHTEIQTIEKELNPLQKMVESAVHNGTHVLIKLAENGISTLLKEAEALVRDLPGPMCKAFEQAITDAENSVHACMGASSDVTEATTQ